MKILDGLEWRQGDGSADSQGQIIQNEHVMRGIVFAVCAPVFEQKNIFVSVHNLDAPVDAIEVQQLFRRGIGLGQTGDEIYSRPAQRVIF